MSLNGCVALAVRSGRMTQEQADELVQTAAAFANEQVDSAQKAIDAQFTESALRRKQAALQALAKVRTITDQAAHPLGKSTGLNSILGRDLTGLATHENVDQAGDAILQGYWRRLVDPLDAMRTKALGLVQDTEIARSVVRAIMGRS